MDQILQRVLPTAPWREPGGDRLPGMQPLDMADWLIVDEAFAAQMAERDRLIATRRAETCAMLDGAEPAAAEVLAMILSWLQPGCRREGPCVTRPDGVTVDLEAAPPLISAARLVQEDLCVLQKSGADAEHVLTAAVLCFPASWTLAEKLGRPLSAIHDPVDSYTPEIARRVQRLFDKVRANRPMWRQNALLYGCADLYQPRREAAPRPAPARADYLRSERQSVLRLPQTDAVLFTIHSYVLPVASLGASDRGAVARLERIS